MANLAGANKKRMAEDAEVEQALMVTICFQVSGLMQIVAALSQQLTSHICTTEIDFPKNAPPENKTVLKNNMLQNCTPTSIINTHIYHIMSYVCMNGSAMLQT